MLAAGRSTDLSQVQAHARSTTRSSRPLIRIAAASGARIASTAAIEPSEYTIT